MLDTGSVRVKICGLTDQTALDAAISAGAAYIGFNFFPPSPRYLTLQAAQVLATSIPPGIAKVGLTVDADDTFLDALVKAVHLDMLQLHGHETPARVSEVKSRYGLPVMKVLGIADAQDLAQIEVFAPVSDQLLLDTKPPKDAVLPGGNGARFDWALLTQRRMPIPWMLAGGLTPDNVPDAIAATGAQQVDVASGVEAERGKKHPALIKAFVEAATRATVET